MADFTKTISNSVNAFGGGPSSKWGEANYPYTFTWGTTKWGEGTFSIVFSVEKLIENSTAPDTTLIFEVEKLVSEAFTASGDMSGEALSDGLWNYVFTSDTTEGEQRDSANWSDTSQASTSYTCIAAASTIWT